MYYPPGYYPYPYQQQGQNPPPQTPVVPYYSGPNVISGMHPQAPNPNQGYYQGGQSNYPPQAFYPNGQPVNMGYQQQSGGPIPQQTPGPSTWPQQQQAYPNFNQPPNSNQAVKAKGIRPRTQKKAIGVDPAKYQVPMTTHPSSKKSGNGKMSYSSSAAGNSQNSGAGDGQKS